MARLYANENFPFPVVVRLRELGHDVLTTRDAGTANQGIPDEQVLAFAAASQRTVITQNRRDFVRLHRKNPDHAGIVACTENYNFDEFAECVHSAIKGIDKLSGQLIRVNRSLPPQA